MSGYDNVEERELYCRNCHESVVPQYASWVSDAAENRVEVTVMADCPNCKLTIVTDSGWIEFY